MCLSCHPPLEYFSADEKRSPVAVRLPIGWVLSGPLPSSSCLTSTCFKVNIEHDKELASQVKAWYDIESFGANKQVDSRSAADARAREYDGTQWLEIRCRNIVGSRQHQAP